MQHTAAPVIAPFGIIAKRSRQDLDLSLDQLAYCTGITANRLRRIETGADCTADERREIAAVLRQWLAVHSARVDRLLKLAA